MRKLILASSSPSRKELLERFKIPFEIHIPDIDENPKVNEKPADLVLRLSYEKAAIFVDTFPDALIIGSDIVGVMDNQIINKPETRENAVKQLLSFSGRKIEFLAGVCLLDSKTKKSQVEVEKIEVVFRELSLERIERYLAVENVLNAAGSVKVEGVGIAPVR